MPGALEDPVRWATGRYGCATCPPGMLALRWSEPGDWSGKRDTLQKNRERSPTNLVQPPAPPCDSPVALRGLLYLSESKLPHQ